MQVSVAYEFLPKRRTVCTSEVMDHFGIGFETGRHVLADQLELPIEPGEIVCCTGPSGSGKSSILRAAAAQLPGVLDADRLELGDEPLVDALRLPTAETLELLAACGLSEARLLLRTPAELSDGQRYRFRLALALSRNPAWILADEFTAALDRSLAKVLAYNVQRLSRKRGTGFLLATTHTDILDDLQPAVQVLCRLEGGCEVLRRDVKKKGSVLAGRCGSAPEPSPTGRTSLGGITAATSSGSSAS